MTQPDDKFKIMLMALILSEFAELMGQAYSRSGFVSETHRQVGENRLYTRQRRRVEA
jgi:hypothetical protein